jgi:hypothetical protein
MYYLLLFITRNSRLQRMMPIGDDDADTERQLAEQVAQILREWLSELEALEATGTAPKDTGTRLALIRKLLARLERQFRDVE